MQIVDKITVQKLNKAIDLGFQCLYIYAGKAYIIHSFIAIYRTGSEIRVSVKFTTTAKKTWIVKFSNIVILRS